MIKLWVFLRQLYYFILNTFHRIYFGSAYDYAEIPEKLEVSNVDKYVLAWYIPLILAFVTFGGIFLCNLSLDCPVTLNSLKLLFLGVLSTDLLIISFTLWPCVINHSVSSHQLYRTFTELSFPPVSNREGVVRLTGNLFHELLVLCWLTGREDIGRRVALLLSRVSVLGVAVYDENLGLIHTPRGFDPYVIACGVDWFALIVCIQMVRSIVARRCGLKTTRRVQKIITWSSFLYTDIDHFMNWSCALRVCLQIILASVEILQIDSRDELLSYHCLQWKRELHAILVTFIYTLPLADYVCALIFTKNWPPGRNQSNSRGAIEGTRNPVSYRTRGSTPPGEVSTR
ncbi:unnamed protein product [Calicophoron daubneyi]|uniref:Gustatory receptor n=1 Tax=Calicophoron daubneyi TaxID=300641 RepID=A0AAV2T600_CALDB